LSIPAPPSPLHGKHHLPIPWFPPQWPPWPDCLTGYPLPYTGRGELPRHVDVRGTDAINPRPLGPLLVRAMLPPTIPIGELGHRNALISFSLSCNFLSLYRSCRLAPNASRPSPSTTYTAAPPCRRRATVLCHSTLLVRSQARNLAKPVRREPVRAAVNWCSTTNRWLRLSGCATLRILRCDHV
jgi:hypothetical protein